MKRIPVTILTGFLGAGKTTFLNALLEEHGYENTAVIVNEFGEAGVDASLIEKGDARAFAQSTGCLCCTVSGDVRLTLLRLLDEAERGAGPQFDRVVIETTGMADPAPVLQTFMTNDFILERFALNGVVTLVDAINGPDAMKRFEEAHRQLGVADIVVLTKTDVLQPEAQAAEEARLLEWLQAASPNARAFLREEVSAGDVFSCAAFDPAGKPPDVRTWLRFEAGTHHAQGHDHEHEHHHDQTAHGDTATAFCFSADAPVDPQSLDAAIGALQATYGPDLLRIKGLVDIGHDPDCPLLVHVVGHVANPPKLLYEWPEDIDETRLVFIIAGPGRKAAPGMIAEFLPQLRPYTAPAHPAAAE